MDCYTLQRKVKRHIKRITEMTKNTDNVNTVESELSTFRAASEEVKKAVATLMNDLEPEEDLAVASDWYALQSGHMIDFIETTEQWMSSAKEKILNSLDDRSECSRRSGSSRRSKASSTSVASGRAKERAKAAEVMAKFAMLERRQELEKRTERLLLEEQLAVAHARERAYAEFEDDALEEKPHVLPVHLPLTVFHSSQFEPFPRPHPPPVPQAYSPPGQVEPTAAPYSQFNPCVPEFKMKQSERQNASEGVQEVLSQQNRLTELGR